MRVELTEQERMRLNFEEMAEMAAEWHDISAICDRQGAPKGMSLVGRVTWIMNKAGIDTCKESA